MSKKNLIIGIVIILIILTIVLVAQRPKEKLPEEEPPAAHVPRTLASGKQVYEAMTDSSVTFKIAEAEFDPLDVKEGETQRVKVLVEDREDNPITSENKVEGIAITDNKEIPFSFKLIQVSDANGGTLTEWEGFWTLEDTYDRTYMISITAKAADQKHKVDLTFR
jgi:hypothetical protein